jgi:MipA family protein
MTLARNIAPGRPAGRRAHCLCFCLGFASMLTFHALQARAVEPEDYVGAGARLRPAYAGASSNRIDAIPYLRLYGDHFFARTTQGILEGGWRTRPFGHIVLGAQLAYEEGREADESAFLKERKFEDLDPSASVGVHAEGDWKIGSMPLNALLRYRHDVDGDNGAQADLRVTAGVLAWRRIRAGLFAQLTWGDSESTQRFFGITSAQAASAGLPAHSAGAGLRATQVGLVGDVDITRHWVGLWGISLERLQGDAADSPLTLDRNGWYANAGVAYRF